MQTLYLDPSGDSTIKFVWTKLLQCCQHHHSGHMQSSAFYNILHTAPHPPSKGLQQQIFWCLFLPIFIGKDLDFIQPFLAHEAFKTKTYWRSRLLSPLWAASSHISYFLLEDMLSRCKTILETRLQIWQNFTYLLACTGTQQYYTQHQFSKKCIYQSHIL